MPHSVALTTGCASIVGGHNQSVSIDTPGCGGAACTLTNSKGNWYVQAPGTVTVHRAYGDLAITCKHENGATASANIQSSTKALAFGNIIFGGLIGVGIDVGTGAAYDYPQNINIPMNCGTAQKTAAPAKATGNSAQTAQESEGSTAARQM